MTTLAPKPVALPKTTAVIMVRGPYVGKHAALVGTNDECAYVVINGYRERVDFSDYVVAK